MARLRDTFQKLQLLSQGKVNTQLQWCAVDTENKFILNNTIYIIDESVEQYKVNNKPLYDENESITNNWTNDAEMDRILCVTENDNITFYDQSINYIENALVKQAKGEKGRKER